MSPGRGNKGHRCDLVGESVDLIIGRWFWSIRWAPSVVKRVPIRGVEERQKQREGR